MYETFYSNIVEGILLRYKETISNIGERCYNSVLSLYYQFKVQALKKMKREEQTVQ